MRLRHFAVAVLFSLTLVAPAEAKRVIYVTSGTDISWMEGYYRKNPLSGDVFVREDDAKKFTDAWAALAAGDELIVCGHGTTGAISIEGGQYGGFKLKGAATGGTGVSCPAYELPALALDNLTVTFKTCFAGSTPTGTNEKSVKDSLLPLLTGANPTINAETRAVTFGYKPLWKTSDNGTQQQRLNALDCLDEQVLRDGGDDQDAKRFNLWLNKKSYQQLEAINQYLQNPPCTQDVDSWQLTFAYDPPTEPQPIADRAIAFERPIPVPVDDAADFSSAAL